MASVACAAASTIRYRFSPSDAPSGHCTPSECASLASALASSVYDLPIGPTALQLTVTAQAGEQCTYYARLSRARSSDTALALVSVPGREEPSPLMSHS